jgi:hypothetical protein
MSSDNDDVAVGSVGFAQRALERAERAPEASADNEYAARHRAVRVQQTAETVRLARASEAAERRNRS